MFPLKQFSRLNKVEDPSGDNRQSVREGPNFGPLHWWGAALGCSSKLLELAN